MAIPEEVILGEVASDFTYGSGAKSRQSGQVPVLRMGNIQGGQLDWSDLVYTSDPIEIEKYRLRLRDVLFNRTNSPELGGKTALFNENRPAIFAGYLIRVRCSQKLMPAYLVYCLNSPAGRDYCWKVKTDGVSQSNINAKKLAAFRFPLPSLAEQEEIVRRIDAAFAWLDRLIAELVRAARLLAKLDQAILAKAFRGELVPQNPADESAAVLLNRMRAPRTDPPKPKRGHQPREIRTLTMANPREQLQKHLETWPDRGLSFEQVAARISGDYEAIKDAVFALLAGPTPALRQQFDEKDRLMRIRRAAL
jgi:type I restriction enzyme, S subunit